MLFDGVALNGLCHHGIEVVIVGYDPVATSGLSDAGMVRPGLSVKGRIVALVVDAMRSHNNSANMIQ